MENPLLADLRSVAQGQRGGRKLPHKHVCAHWTSHQRIIHADSTLLHEENICAWLAEAPLCLMEERNSGSVCVCVCVCVCVYAWGRCWGGHAHSCQIKAHRKILFCFLQLLLWHCYTDQAILGTGPRADCETALRITPGFFLFFFSDSGVSYEKAKTQICFCPTLKEFIPQTIIVHLANADIALHCSPKNVSIKGPHARLSSWF